MRYVLQLAAAASFALPLLGGGSAFANVCRTHSLMCATTMPVNGYCECSAHGHTEDGTVMASPVHRHINATAGGCGVHANDPGCGGTGPTHR